MSTEPNEPSSNENELGEKMDTKKPKTYGLSFNPFSIFERNLGKTILSRKTIVAPNIISFYEDRYQMFFDFIEEVCAAAKKSTLTIDIRGLREVKAAALLVLYANIETIQKKLKNPHVIKFTYCSNKAMASELGRFGFWRLTRQALYRPEYNMSGRLAICTASHLANRSGDNSEIRKVIQHTQNAIREYGLEDENALAFSAITESISNVWQHAYDSEFYQGDLEFAHWWIIVERIADQFYIAVYDTGVGIPLTIESKAWYSKMFFLSDGKLYEYAVDAYRIKMAVEYGRSRFKVDNRGKGLSEAKDFVMSNPEGIMIIFSGFGSYTYHTEGEREDLKPLRRMFPGTLIQWNLTLEPVK